MRRRYTAVARDWSFTIGPITGTELARLDTFYTTDTAQGSTSFTWVDENGASRSFRFTAPMRYRCIVGHHVPGQRMYEVDVELEQLVS
jgi:FtsP/CotA-like multicopper oxidase with cupredoxin domain